MKFTQAEVFTIHLCLLLSMALVPSQAVETKRPVALTKGTEQSVPAGTKITVVLQSAVDSNTTKDGTVISARLKDDIFADGKLCVPKNSMVVGKVREVGPRGGRGMFSIGFNRLILKNGDTIAMEATPWVHKCRVSVIRGDHKLLFEAVWHDVKKNNGLDSTVDNKIRADIFAPKGLPLRLEKNDEFAIELFDFLRIKKV